MQYEINYIPVSWKAHKGSGARSYNPRQKEKDICTLSLKIQHRAKDLLRGPLRIDIFFEMPIPKHLEKKYLARIESGEKIWHTTRPDRTNLLKFAEDTLIGTVLADDNAVCCGETQKYYSKTPRTRFFIQEIN